MSAAIPAEKFDALNAMIGQFKDAEERLKELEATEAEQEKVLEQRKRDQASKEPGVSSGGGNKSESELRLKGELADEVAWKKSQTEALKKDAPEGLIEGDPVQYFLVVSALQESIEELKSQKAFSESSLDNRMQNVAAINNLIEKTSNVTIEPPVKRSKGGSGDGHELGREGMNESTAPDQKLRATKKVYRDMKMFLGKYLDELAPPDQEDNTGLAPLLQQLWDTFFKEGPEAYVKVSHLEFDVQPETIVRLDKAEIIEKNPEDSDELRLVDFTE